MSLPIRTALLALLLTPFGALEAQAQDDDFEFGEDDFGGDGDGDGEEGAGGDDEEITFESDEEPDEGSGEDSDDEMNFASEAGETKPRTVVLVIPSPGAEPELAHRLTDALERYVASTDKYEVIESDEFRAQLFGPGSAAAMDCATNAVCLSGYGKDMWIDSIVLGVLYRGDGGWKTEANKIDVERAEVESYASQDDTSLDRRKGPAMDEIAGIMGAKLLGLTVAGAGDDDRRVKLVARRGALHTRLAWAAAGLAGAALVTATVFGMQASAKESEAKESDTTQVRAQALIGEGEGKARDANIFLGVSVAAALGSAALFLIKPLQEEEVAPQGPTPGFDGEPGAGRSPWSPELRWTGAGAAATWRLP